MDKRQVAEAVDCEIIFDLIFTIVAKTEGRNGVAGQNG
jgi:hypothetical protein